MAEIKSFHHERVDDFPLNVGMCKKLRWPEILDRHLGTHGLQQGLNNGQLTVGWLGYILSQADHRKSAVQEWANDNPHTLGRLLEHPIRETEFNDDRLGGVLRRLSEDETWAAIEWELWGPTVAVYEMESTDVRLDSTTSYGYHDAEKSGLMQYGGHSKDHRPDLPQLKLMAAAAEPSGHLIASDVVAGHRAVYVGEPGSQRVGQRLGVPCVHRGGDFFFRLRCCPPGRRPSATCSRLIGQHARCTLPQAAEFPSTRYT